MDRREFLHRMKKPAIALAAVPAVALAAADRGREKLGPHVKALKNKVVELNKRVDKLEKNQKRAIRVLFVITGITLGFDISHLL